MISTSKPECNGTISKKVLLIFPREKGVVFSNDTLYPFPILGLSLLASLFPENYHVRIVNEAIESVDFDEKVDLVGITGLTCVVNRAYAIADRFRANGVSVLLGGAHPSLLPEEAMEHADAVIVGEAEGVFREVIRDFEAGRLRKCYQNNGWTDIKEVPFARRELLSKRYGSFLKVIQTTRGCPNRCEFCSVPIMNGKQYRRRTLEDIDRELSLIVKKEGEYIFLADDNITAVEDYALGLFEVFQRHHVKWMGFTSIKIAENEYLLKKAGESGCVSLFIGFESLIQKNLDGASKHFVKTERLSEWVRAIQFHGIGIQGSFIFGFDDDDPGIFEKTVGFVQNNRIELPTFSILTPFPGTPLYQRLEAERRIFDRNWSHYDMSHVVFTPGGMSARALQEGYLWAQKFICAPRSILRRLLQGSKNHLGHFLMSNFLLRGAQMQVINRIKKEQNISFEAFPTSIQ